MDDPLHGQAKAASLKPSTSHPEGAYALNEEDFANMFSEEGLAKMTEELSKAFSDFATMNPDHLGGATSTDGQSDAGKGRPSIVFFEFLEYLIYEVCMAMPKFSS